MRDYSAKQLKDALPNFKKIWDSGKEINPLPDNVKLTVYCEGEKVNDRGFVENVTSSELGLEYLIAHSWILQEDLDKLLMSQNA